MTTLYVVMESKSKRGKLIKEKFEVFLSDLQKAIDYRTVKEEKEDDIADWVFVMNEELANFLLSVIDNNDNLIGKLTQDGGFSLELPEIETVYGVGKTQESAWNFILSR
ncbi:MAG: hypothetical protein ACXWFB_05960 [Nitrososphaeraceae archaeon]